LLAAGPFVKEAGMRKPYRWVPFLSPVYRAVRRFVNRLAYAGDRVACPVCEHTFRGWLHHPQHGNCPYCRSESRHRLLWLVLAEDRSGGQTKRDLLHFAPEWCLERRFRTDGRLGRYVTADLSAPGVDVHTDITALSFADGSFDAIVCSHVLEHIPDDRAAMRELHRVLRPGGVAYVQVPIAEDQAQTDEDPTISDPKERARRFGQFDHVRLYGRDLVERLTTAGFSVEQLRPVRSMTPEKAARWGVWDDILFRCQRG
jgi:SAM-dependent methyltransferase